MIQARPFHRRRRTPKLYGLMYPQCRGHVGISRNALGKSLAMVQGPWKPLGTARSQA